MCVCVCVCVCMYVCVIRTYKEGRCFPFISFTYKVMKN